MDILSEAIMEGSPAPVEDEKKETKETKPKKAPETQKKAKEVKEKKETKPKETVKREIEQTEPVLTPLSTHEEPPAKKPRLSVVYVALRKSTYEPFDCIEMLDEQTDEQKLSAFLTTMKSKEFRSMMDNRWEQMDVSPPVEQLHRSVLLWRHFQEHPEMVGETIATPIFAETLPLRVLTSSLAWQKFIQQYTFVRLDLHRLSERYPSAFVRYQGRCVSLSDLDASCFPADAQAWSAYSPSDFCTMLYLPKQSYVRECCE